MNTNKIIPCLWFNAGGGTISRIVEYYKNIFGSDFQEGAIIPLGETPSGHTEMCEVQIFLSTDLVDYYEKYGFHYRTGLSSVGRRIKDI